MDIVFYTADKFEEKNYPVLPASHYVPEWYKNITPGVDGEKLTFKDGVSNATIRKCVPFLEAMTAGYIVQLAQDVFISREELIDPSTGYQSSIPYYSWGLGGQVAFHDARQAPGHPGNKSNYPIPKFTSNWSIMTPNGYSCMFIPPMNRDDLPFRIMSGIVDTDTYHTPVNFPFTLVDPNFTGLIKAGTPIAQIIPFKRDKWKMNSGSKKSAQIVDDSIQKLRRLAFHGYKKLFWVKKEFK